jgi:hypothetical protein
LVAIKGLKPSRARRRERRAYRRFHFGKKGFCEVGLVGRTTVWRADVRDISAGGVGLLIDLRFEPGTALAIRLHTPNAKAALPLSVQVRHVVAGPNGTWVLGSAWNRELTAEEIGSTRRQ